MANKKRKRKRRPDPAAGNGHKPEAKIADAESAAPATRATLPVPRERGANLYPPVWRSLGRGLAAAASIRILIIALAVPLLTWFLLIALGFRFFPPQIADVLAIPPMSAALDQFVSTSLVGISLLLLGALIVITVVRAVIWALLIGMLDEVMEYGSVSKVGILRGMRALPAVILYEYLVAVVAFLAQPLSQLIPGAGSLLSLLLPIAVVYFLTFAPIAAIRLQIRGVDSLSRSSRAARLPGWPRYLVLCVLYVFVITLGRLFLTPDALEVTATPSYVTWLYVFFSAYLNVAFLAAFIDAWKAVEPYVPQAQPRERPAPRRR